MKAFSVGGDPIIGVGIDSESLSRFLDKPFVEHAQFYQQIFTEQEINYCLHQVRPYQHFAARYCAKEAFIKALPSKVVDYRTIEVRHDAEGRPTIAWGGVDVFLSLAHDDSKALASVIITKSKDQAVKAPIAPPNTREVIEGRRVLLQPITPQEITATYLSWLNDPSINEFLEVRHKKQMTEDIITYINTVRADPEREVFAIFLSGEHVHVGTVAITSYDQYNKVATYGLMIGEKSAQMMGVGAEASVLIIEYLFQYRGVRKISGKILAKNERSWRSSESIGFQREGVLRAQSILASGETDDQYVYGLLASEWGRVRQRSLNILQDMNVRPSTIESREIGTPATVPPISRAVSRIGQAVSVRYNMKVYDLQRGGNDVIVLSLGESFFDIPLLSFHALKNWEKGYHYSSSRGVPELRNKISNYYEKEYRVPSDPDSEVLISAGSKVILYMIMSTILNPGDEIIVLEPAWVSYHEQIRLCHGEPVMVPYDEDVGRLHAYVTPRTRAIIINNPNNPSGKVYSEQELRCLYETAKAHNLYVISDEAYSDFIGEEPFLSIGLLDVRKERVFIVNSLSKNFGMSGWRIGYVISNRHLIDQLFKVNQHLMTCPTTLIEYYMAEYFDEVLRVTKPQIQAVVQKRRQVARFMDGIGLQYLSGSGTFYFMVSIARSKLSSEAFADMLLDAYHVATVPGIGYGQSLDRFLRVGVGTESMERIQQGLRTIRECIERTSS